jgi:hypothetical protein
MRADEGEEEEFPGQIFYHKHYELAFKFGALKKAPFCN